MPSLPQRFFVDTTGKYLGSWAGFKHPDEFLLDREGAVILFDAHGAPSEVGEPLLVREGVVIEPTPPAGAIEVAFPPADGRAKWDGTKWIEPPLMKKPVDLDTLIRVLVAKGVVTAEDLVMSVV